MRNRLCPFCPSESSIIMGIRGDAWVKCRGCRSIFRDITPDRFRQLHDEAFQDNDFIVSVVAANGHTPASARWKELSLPGASVLEIGPGSGHLIAAAQQDGRSVTAVETSEIHRNFLRETWGIGDLYEDLRQIPARRTFDAIIAINIIEHVYDISDFLCATRKMLSPGGTFFLSMPNAASLEAVILKNWWSMCKEHDHVSFPSPDGMALAARASGFRIERIWSAELPFEFPISALVAIRDRIRERQDMGSFTGDSQAQDQPGLDGTGSANTAKKAKLARFYSAAASFDPASRVLGVLGRAASVKARLKV